MADNWDDDDSTPPTSFGKTLVTGGAVLGIGRGNNKGSGGFGSVSKPGPLGGMSGDNPGESGGFGSNRSRTFADIENTNSGFGSRDCFGSNGDGLSFAEQKGSGSFGGGSGGGRQSDSRMTGKSGCFKCGEEGHMSRDCTNASARGGRSGGSGGKGCFKCGEEGHMSRDCTNAAARGGRSSGGKGCYKCGEEGHMSRDCPQGGGGGGRNSGACFKCNEQGHQSRDCPNKAASGFQKAERAAFGSSFGFDDAAENGFGAAKPRAGFGDLSEPSFGGTIQRSGFGGDSLQSSSTGGDRDNKKGCFKCGEEGHLSRDCPQGGGAGGGRKSGCFKCGEEGHMSRDCPNAAAEQSGEKRPAPYVPPPLPEDEEHLFATLQKGINFDKYDKIPVECTGTNAPKRGITSFAESDIHGILKENVLKAKYDKPTPIQKWAVPIILSGRDMMACAQTGSGKTAAFLLPVLSGMIRNGIEGSAFSAVQEPQAVVVGPTRELVTQIYQEARKFAYNSIIRPVVVYGGVTSSHQLREVEQGCHIVVGTAGRLLDFIRKGKISLRKVKYFILDEADRMLDMGFLPDMKALANELGMPPKTERQTLMFSATFPEEVQRLAQELLNDYIFVTVGRVGSANTDIEQHMVQVDQFNKRDELVRILNSQSGMQRTLVFVEQKRQADFLASFLSQSEFPTTSIHGDREQREREEALRDFKNGNAPIMVATSVAARGLDIPGVMHVVNFDMPQSIDEYVHRIGRTGRCGNMGKATSFFNPSTDSALARPLIKLLVDAQQEVPDWLENLAQESHGYGGFTQSTSQYGAKDTRHGNFGDKSDGGSSLVPGPSAVADIDDWD